MASGRIALCLIDADNEFQQVAAQDAEAAARRAGLDLETHWSGAALSAQLSQIRHLLDSPSPPSAMGCRTRSSFSPPRPSRIRPS